MPRAPKAGGVTPTPPAPIPASTALFLAVQRSYESTAPAPLFPEPDHEPEFEAQRSYEFTRSLAVYAGGDDPETADPDLNHPAPGAHTGSRRFCAWPSHARWFRDAYPSYRSRDDHHTD